MEITNETLAPITGLYAVVQPGTGINHTTLAATPKSAIAEWMNQEQAAAHVFRKSPAPSWEGYEALGYRVTRVSIVHTPNELYP